jgi:DNA-directed RNA polymerase specialized sigma24 family protein
MLPADERRPAPDALSAIHADLAADRMLASLTPLQEKLIVAYTGLDGPSIVDHRKLAKLTGLSVTQVAAEIDTALQAMQAVVEVAA